MMDGLASGFFSTYEYEGALSRYPAYQAATVEQTGIDKILVCWTDEEHLAGGVVEG
ncbi:MAG: hypothetical protein HOC74_14485 [Gemmatimonadetes bacterium]|nr:hypothetical protein [Gemmatimonadota bacterium]